MQSIATLRHYDQDLIHHDHVHTQLVFGLQGQLEFEIESRGDCVMPQILAVVPAGMAHACSSRQGSQCLVLDIAEDIPALDHQEAIQKFLLQPFYLNLDIRQNQLLHWLLDSLEDDPRLVVQGIWLMLASLSRTTNAPSPVLPLAQLNRFLDRHRAHPVQIDDIAHSCGLSSTQLSARFVRDTGLTPMAYVRQRRLSQAYDMLLNTTLAVGTIAAQVGYESQSAFTAAFSRQYAMTPRRLRQQSRDNLDPKRDRQSAATALR